MGECLLQTSDCMDCVRVWKKAWRAGSQGFRRVRTRCVRGRDEVGELEWVWRMVGGDEFNPSLSLVTLGVVSLR